MIRKCIVCNKTDVNFISYDKPVSCDYCGKYYFTDDVENSKPFELYSNDIYLLSAAIYKKTNLGEISKLTTASIPELIKSIKSKPPLEIIDDILEYVSQKANSIIDEIELSEKDVPKFVLKNKKELFEYLTQIEKLDFWKLVQYKNDPTSSIFTRKVKLTLNGWRKINEIRKTKIDSNQAFVAMWFKDSMDQYYKDGIKLALENTGFTPIIMVKDIQQNEKIDDLIFTQIRKSGLLIADFTGNRPAVYFEAGFAKGLNIPVIWLCRESDKKKLCFDTRQYNHIIWKNADDLKYQLINRIASTIPGHLPK